MLNYLNILNSKIKHKFNPKKNLYYIYTYLCNNWEKIPLKIRNLEFFKLVLVYE